jgi:hypothetical protein
VFGADITWDISTASTLNINMVVNTPAVPMIFQSQAATGCATGTQAGNLLCVPSTADGTTGVTFANEYVIGLLWTNPDSTAAVKYDGISMKIDLKALAPAGTQNTCGPASTTFAACTASFTIDTVFAAAT